MVRVEHLAEGGLVELHDPWLSEAEAAALFEELRESVPFRQETIRLFGREHLQPRLTAWFGDPEAVYTYSGLTLTPEPWAPPLAALRARVEAACGQPFNSVLLNYYRGGDDAMGFHADAERELGKDPVIASVSLGAPRRFVLKYTGRQKGVPTLELDLGRGSLLVMAGSTQHHYRHGVPRQRGAGARINMTFRRIVGG